MGERQFVWDEVSDGLTLLGIQTTEEEQIKGRKKQVDPVQASKVYCPHAYLILNFRETLNEGEKIKFRRYYLRKVSPNEPDVIILQDIKDLVLFLLASPVSPQFINFFHLPIVDRFLRALIIYFQYYITTWEELMQERAATMKKASNPLAQGYRARYTDEMHSLRCILGREYGDLILGCLDIIQYHHMTAGKKGGSTITQSQGEKDLRIFEVLICMSHRVVWIAMHRKYFNLIEIELHRLLRTEAYNTAKRRNISQILQDMLEDDIRVLHGREIQSKRKLLRNSPLVEELVYASCDYRLLSLGMTDTTDDPRILYLQNALLIEEEKLAELGIKVGILGHKRADYDVMLMPAEEEKPDDSKIQLSERGMFEKQKSSVTEDSVSSDTHTRILRLPSFTTHLNVAQTFPIKITDVAPKGYKKVREESRKKWLFREIKRQNRKQADTYSTGTSIE